MMESMKKMLALAVACVLATMALTGCGTTGESAMKEYVSPDETVSIMLEENWVEEDTESMGMSGWICASSQDQNEVAMVMQFQKGIMDAGIAEVSDLRAMMEESYGVSESVSVEAPQMGNLVNTEAYTCMIDVDGVTDNGYIVYGETDYAYYAVMYAGGNHSDKKLEYIQKIFASFKETVKESENVDATEVSDTVQWINGTYALLTQLNGWDYNIYGAMPVNDTTSMLQQQMLEEWWGVTDRQTADDNLEWLLGDGHRVPFVEDVMMLEEVGVQEVLAEERAALIYENYEMTEEEAGQWAEWYNAYEMYGEAALAGWDYSRAISVLSNYYVAGYYTEEEALNQSLEIALMIQSSFDSWDSFMESYFMGYEYWAEESSDERRAVYEELKQASDSPYNLDWNLNLQRTW